MEYCPHKANRIFVTLQTVLMEVMKIKGCNKYDIPHMQKERLEREERLPLQISCDPLLLAEAVGSLDACTKNSNSTRWKAMAEQELAVGDYEQCNLTIFILLFLLSSTCCSHLPPLHSTFLPLALHVQRSGTIELVDALNRRTHPVIKVDEAAMSARQSSK